MKTLLKFLKYRVHFLLTIYSNDRIRYQIYDTVKAGIRNSRNWTELQHYIRYRSVEMQFKYKSGTNEIQGISFSKDGHTFRGSAVDRSMSYGQIDKALNHMDYSKEINQTIVSTPSVDRNMESGFENTIGEITSSLFSLPVSAPDPDDSLAKKKKKKDYGLKR